MNMGAMVLKTYPRYEQTYILGEPTKSWVLVQQGE